MKTSSILFAAVASAAIACSGSVEREHDGTVPAALSTNGRITVMSRNVYLGANVDAVFAATSAEEVPGLVAGVWAQMIGNDFPARARAIADEIAAAQPNLVGLQEPALFHRFPADGSATETIDFLAILQTELAARGLDYRVVVAQTDSDVLVPMFAGYDGSGAPILDGVEMIDRDAILARGDVVTSNATSGRYVQGLPIELGGTTVEVVRGWTSVVATTDRGAFRFVETHLDDYVPDVQLAQADELLRMLAPETLPTVLVGDFNSAADGSTTPTYAYVTGSGFTDTWTRANGKDPGYSCCHAADLHVADAPLAERVDLVLLRDRGRAVEGRVMASLVGTSMTPEGLWPSDHAGLVTSFRLH